MAEDQKLSDKMREIIEKTVKMTIDALDIPGRTGVLADKYIGILKAGGDVKEQFRAIGALASITELLQSWQTLDGSAEFEAPDIGLIELERAIQREEANLMRSRRMATLGVMASGLAHEINQPLQIILSVAQNCATEIRRDVIDNEGILADLDKVTANTERINKIVNHLLVLSRDHKPKLELVDVNTVIENSFIMFYQQLTKARGIKIVKNLSEKLPSIKADSIQMEQVFINLINNARDALYGCKDGIIEVSTTKQDEHILVAFGDSGKGIAPEDLPKIFDAFFTTKEEGMGLGLHIARDIVESYGGTITVDSEVNKWTAFLIALPVAEEEAK